MMTGDTDSIHKDSCYHLDDMDRQLLTKVVLPEHDKLLTAIRQLNPTTGRADTMFCNVFMIESVELIKHALYLYEDGYFDCAFYSLRQSVETMNSMLFLSQDETQLTRWKEKAWFPIDSHVKQQLSKDNAAYLEIKNAIPDFFNKYDGLLAKANKYIHKQGFDTFYALNGLSDNEEIKTRTSLFVELMKYSIGMILVINITLDPLSLALSDPKVDRNIPFDPLTMPIPVSMFEEFLSSEIIYKIKETSYYQGLSSFFLEQVELNSATYYVKREQHFQIRFLNEIEEQKQVLSFLEVLMLRILQAGIPAAHFYTDNDIIGYSTSNIPPKCFPHFSLGQLKSFFDNQDFQNRSWRDLYISTFRRSDFHLMILHIKPLSDPEIKSVQSIISREEL